MKPERIKTTEKKWIKIDVHDDIIRDGEIRRITPNGREIILVKKQKSIYAFLNKCPHLECPLDYGSLEGFMLKCPCHDWKFDIRTGEFVDAKEIKLERFDARIKDGEIYLNL